MHKLDAWNRLERKIGANDMREFLQTVVRGTTEYSIVTRPRRFPLAWGSAFAHNALPTNNPSKLDVDRVP